MAEGMVVDTQAPSHFISSTSSSQVRISSLALLNSSLVRWILLARVSQVLSIRGLDPVTRDKARSQLHNQVHMLTNVKKKIILNKALSSSPAPTSLVSDPVSGRGLCINTRGGGLRSLLLTITRESLMWIMVTSPGGDINQRHTTQHFTHSGLLTQQGVIGGISFDGR